MAALRQRYPQTTVAQLYDRPRLGSLAGFLDDMGRSDPAAAAAPCPVQPMPRLTQAAQVLLSVPLATLSGLQWVTWLALLNNVVAAWHPLPWLARLDWWWVIAGFVLFVTPLGRMGIAALGPAHCWPACSPAAIGAAAPNTCGSGSPNASRRPAAPRIWPAHRGWCITRGHWATRSARASICTPRRR